MKKIVLLFLAPLFLATQCEDDMDNSGFESSYFIQNDSNFDLFLLLEGGQFIELGSQTTKTIGSNLNSTTEPISPSESSIVNHIKLYKMENNNFILAYEQNPISDDLWIFNEPLMNNFEYRLIISNELLD